MHAPSRRSVVRGAALLATLSWPALAPALADTRPVTVFAAASLKDALDTIAGQHARETGKAARISYAGSNTLALQIERGAPADVFISADAEWMDRLDRKGLLAPETRIALLGNRLVLVARRGAAVPLDLRPGVDLAAALAGGRLAMANVDAVPAGRYGRAALTFLGAWQGVKDKIAQAENVRAALLLVARGEAPLGIVYATDAAGEAAVQTVGVFPEEAHPPIVYPAALLKEATADARAFLDHLRSAQARAVFAAAGFKVFEP